jgi:Cytochrome C oxidase, cbb3-type, subunit III
MNKIKIAVLAGVLITTALASCDSGDKRRTPGHIYAPDMTYSRAFETYTGNPNACFTDSLTNRPPVAGTVARGHQLPDHLSEGDTTAYKTYTTDLRFTDNELDEGRRLFQIYCAICHGPEADGNGPLYSSGKFAAKPANFKAPNYLHMPIGQMYAAVKYGKNAMGSYASQLDIKQRWMVLAYLKKVQSDNGGDAFVYGVGAPTGGAAPKADSSAKPMAAAGADTTKAMKKG